MSDVREKLLDICRRIEDGEIRDNACILKAEGGRINIKITNDDRLIVEREYKTETPWKRDVAVIKPESKVREIEPIKDGIAIHTDDADIKIMSYHVPASYEWGPYWKSHIMAHGRNNIYL